MSSPADVSETPGQKVRGPTTFRFGWFGGLGLLLLLSLAGYWEGVAPLEVASDFRPYYLAIGVFSLVWLGIRHGWRRRGLMGAKVLALAVVLVNAWEVSTLLWPASGDPGSAGTRIKVAAVNVEASNTRFGEVRDWAAGENPDVVMFCESVERWAGELMPLQSVFPHHVRIAPLTMDVFSRHPVVRTQVFFFGEERGFCVVEIQTPGKRLQFIAAHASPRIPRGARGYQERTQLLEEGIGKLVRNLDGPVVLMGDLNVTPWAPVYQRAVKQSGLKDARKGQGLLLTRRSHPFPARLLWNALDHCLVSADVTVERMWTGPYLGSDHRPVLTTLFLPASAGGQAR